MTAGLGDPGRDGSVRIESFSAVPASVEPDGAPVEVRLCWSVRGAERVVLSGHGTVPHSQRGGLVLRIGTTTTFVLTAYGQGFSEIATCARSVSVAARRPGRRIPVGAIAMWSGDPSDLPPGWRLCDGSQGTPDLVDRFVLGAGEPDRVGDRSEGDRHRHTAALRLRGRAREVPGHRHDPPGGWRVEAAAVPGDDLVGIAGALQLGEAGGHGHDVDVPLERTTSEQAVPEPPWYALCFVMWTGEA